VIVIAKKKNKKEERQMLDWGSATQSDPGQNVGAGAEETQMKELSHEWAW